MTKRLVIFLLAVVLGSWGQSGQKGFTCPTNKACQTWPLNGLTPTPAVQRGWLRLLFDTKKGEVAFFGGDNRGSVTFSTSWWTYKYSPTTVSAGSPWSQETTCGEIAKTESYNASDILAQPVSSLTQTTLFLSTKRSTQVNQPINFPVGQMPTMWLDDEEFQYCDFNAVTGQLTVGVWNAANKTCTVDSGQRGIRGTTAAIHGTSAIGFQGCPAPQTLGNKPANDHMPSRHPWRNMAYDSKRGYWWQMSGKPEVYEFTDTWFYDPATGKYVEIPNSNASGRTDGSLEYDSVNDVLVHYGGSHSGSDTGTTEIMCLDTTQTAAVLNALGCSSTRGTYASNNQTYTWNVLGATLKCSGTRWDGSDCNTTTQVMGKGPGLRRTHSLTFDQKNGVFVLFGGTNDYRGTFTSPTCKGPDNTNPPYKWSMVNCPAEPNDVWVYNTQTQTWTLLVNVGDVPGPARRPAIAYNSNGGYFALWEGPVNQTPVAGKYEQGFYTMTVDLVNSQAHWTLTGFGSNGDPQMSAPYSQNSAAPASCHMSGAPAFDQCDHALENLVYDPVNRVFIYLDADIAVGSAVVQTWQIPEIALN